MTNPFVPPPPAEEPVVVDVGDELFGGEVMLLGPASPEVAPRAHPEGPPWPEVEVAATDALCVMGLHGGSGASTVAAMLGDAAVLTGHGWPVAAGWTRPRPVLDVVAVCRNHHKGLAAAREFARQWAEGQLASSSLLGIVVVDDGPKLLGAQAAATRAVGLMTPHGWRVPWYEPWRIEPVDPEGLPRAAASVRRSILKTLMKVRKGRS